MLVQGMETFKNKLGADHPGTLTSMNNLAFIWKRQGRDQEAIRLMDNVFRQVCVCLVPVIPTHAPRLKHELGGKQKLDIDKRIV